MGKVLGYVKFKGDNKNEVIALCARCHKNLGKPVRSGYDESLKAIWVEYDADNGVGDRHVIIVEGYTVFLCADDNGRERIYVTGGAIADIVIKAVEDIKNKAAPGRADILNAAMKCVCGQREQDYGSPENNFAAIAALWSAYKGIDFNAVDVAIMMALMKIARIKSGTATEDSFVDLAGYAACGGELALNSNSER